MTLDEAKKAIVDIEDELSSSTFVVAHTFSRDGKDIAVAMTDRLRRITKKGRLWKSKPFLTAFKNASYGYDDSHAISAGGPDGIFRLTRDHKPANEMMTKIFDRFIDKEGTGAVDIANELSTPLDSLLPVRLVSHHLRLLGLLHRGNSHDTLVLVDFDDTKR